MPEENKKALAVLSPGDLITYNEEQIALIKRTIAKGASDDELALFLYQCKRTGLDPLSRQVYAVKRWSKADNRYVVAIQTSIDGFRLIAERTKEYEGQTLMEWCGEDGEWKDVWTSGNPPVAARVGVHRKGFKEPLYAVARFEAYKQTTREGKTTEMWIKMPDLMTGKCAEALALRRAFPQELSDVYTADEMAQAGGEMHPDNAMPVGEPIYDWRNIHIHFGKKHGPNCDPEHPSGKQLGELSDAALQWYQNKYEPNPDNAQDVRLRRALDMSLSKIPPDVKPAEEAPNGDEPPE